MLKKEIVTHYCFVFLFNNIFIKKASSQKILLGRKEVCHWGLFFFFLLCLFILFFFLLTGCRCNQSVNQVLNGVFC